ncbi:uncharacterized protein N0V89_009904 [Didymosphaeria variabile]|uniref:Uncharacterized protein n=1 Tax=Didymosphaeria variabile TaxID=1932322 RepID=A0A9W8XEQ7_9PLEO|nr:uncharacterized protein N0V89_009904 [Didymosphaeria variabile]KAJ4348527.1 hypothetical protein N0V89_009904 [Didymosphaeria variabile]
MSLLIAMMTVPGLLGTQEAIRQAQSKDKREEHRARRCNFIAHCIKPSLRAREINDRPLVLRDGRIYIHSGAQDDNEVVLACGYYLPYPDSEHEGLVTKTSKYLPVMNWVYADATTYQLRYGIRTDADGNITGPFDCTSHARRITLFKWEGWCAVEEQPNEWAVYFDVNDDGLAGKVQAGTRVLEIEIERREERYKKDEHGGAASKSTETSSYKPEVTTTKITEKPAQTKIEVPEVSAERQGDQFDVSPSEKRSIPQADSLASVKPSFSPPKFPLRHKTNVPPEAPEHTPGNSTSKSKRSHDRPPSSHTNRPPFRPLGPLPFEAKPYQQPRPRTPNMEGRQSPHPRAPPSASRRFQSLDLSRDDAPRPRRVSTDSTARRALQRLRETSSGSIGSSESVSQVPKKKLSIRERASKALKKKRESG